MSNGKQPVLVKISVRNLVLLSAYYSLVEYIHSAKDIIKGYILIRRETKQEIGE